MPDHPQRPRTSFPLRDVAGRTAVVTFVVAGVVCLVTLLIVAAQVWLLIFAGLLFAVLLSTAADALSRWSGLGRGLSLALVVTSLTAAMLGAA